MTSIIKSFFTSSTNKDSRPNDFSDFFNKSSGDKAKVIRKVLREANEEQRKVVGEYKKSQESK